MTYISFRHAIKVSSKLTVLSRTVHINKNHFYQLKYGQSYNILVISRASVGASKYAQVSWVWRSYFIASLSKSTLSASFATQLEQSYLAGRLTARASLCRH